MPHYDEEIIFSYHKPRDVDIAKYQDLREMAKRLALCYREHCPSSRELSIARTLLEESVQMANAAIARHAGYLRKCQDTREAEVAEAERVAMMRAKYPDAKPQRIVPG